MALKAIGVGAPKKPVKTPNEITVAAIKDARDGKVTKVKSVDEFFKSI